MKTNKLITLLILTLTLTLFGGCGETAGVAELTTPTAEVTDIADSATADTADSASVEIGDTGDSPSVTPAKSATEIIILHTNDMHGRVLGDDEGVIGIDRIAALHKNTPDSILLDAGDALHGLPIATLSRGADVAALMAAAGYSAMAVGNHEFNYGWARLAELREIAGFAFLASNVVTAEDNEPFLDDTAVIEIGGVRIGLFGITTESAAFSVMPDYVRGLGFQDPVTTARARVEQLRGQGVDVVVAVTHSGTEGDKGTLSTQLAREVPEIDIIIDGHSHTELPQGLTESGVLIAQTSGHGGSLGRIAVTVENGAVTSKTATLIDFEQAQKTAPDQAVTLKLAAISEGLESLLSEVVGESLDEMSSARSPGVRTQEMPLGSLVADAYREASGAEIAIANGGDIRADLPQGAVTKGDIVSVLPFGNTLMVKIITPALLKEILENGVSGIVLDEDGNIDAEQSPQGRFLQVSGFSFAYDPAKPPGERVVSIVLDGGISLDLDDDTTQITLAGSNYVMTGGDYFVMLTGLAVERELGAADEALAEYVRGWSPVGAGELGRITVVTS
ncbi:MAG: 5'-nucleotidase C-terminal domain-containing protein [Oscillospiraceae bacterium]|nr:5'-nucleotidase C-terminal domain-containing protein [Oscillospiraceae bacterium]